MIAQDTSEAERLAENRELRARLAEAEQELDAIRSGGVDALVVPGHPSTPGYNDPAYPLEGRLLLDS
jgi:predicted TIM-barrel enzyme